MMKMAVRTYKFNDTTQLSPHFNVKEFKCKCGGSHDILISDELVDKLEKLYAKLNCSKIIITSGYRCTNHDKNVGGSGTGQHTKGNAADACCYGQDGKPISSKIVCCAAQDIGFSGIANINTSYQYTHVDVRSGSKWYGDETKGNSSVTADFYTYFGTKKESDSMEMKGIDVSVHNGTIDWNKVKAAGIQFAILRAGYGRVASQKDGKFEENYKNAKAAGIPVGAYWYSYAVTPDEARLEAQVCLEILKRKQFEFPIFFDQEEKKTLDTGKANCSAMIRAFCEVLEKAGYWVGLYTSRSCLSTHIEDDIKTRYAIWAAEWASKLNYSGSVGIWQYSSKGKINGISGDVDLDTAYVDYPASVKKAGLNGFAKQTAAPATTPKAETNKTVTVSVQIGDEVYKGTLAKS